MYSYTPYNEGGGDGKTTLAANLSVAHARNGNDVLVVDLDGQKGGLSSHFGLLQEDETQNGDTIIDFLCKEHEDSLDDLIRTREGVDIIPSTRQLRDFNAAIEYFGMNNPELKKNKQKLLRQLVVRENLHQRYDFLIVDVPKEVELPTQNALYATRNILIPMMVSRKSNLNLEGVVENVLSMEREHDIEIGFIGVVPNDTNDRLKYYKKEIKRLRTRLDTFEQEANKTVPIAPHNISERDALFEGAWSEEESAFKFFEETKDRQDSRSERTLNKIQRLEKWIRYQLSGGDEGEIPNGDTDNRLLTEGTAED
jgi:chromosome partitioning protein